MQTNSLLLILKFSLIEYDNLLYVVSYYCTDNYGIPKVKKERTFYESMSFTFVQIYSEWNGGK